MDFEKFSDKLLTTPQQIVAPQAYAVEFNWYTQYQNFIERMFEGSVEGLNELQPITNHSISIFYTVDSEKEEALNVEKQLKKLFDLNECSVEYIDTREQCLDYRKTVMKDFVIVSSEFWHFLVSHFDGGPQLPVCTVDYQQIKNKSFEKDQDFLTHINIETIPSGLAIPTKNTRLLIVLYLGNDLHLGANRKDEFLVYHIVVPLALQISQLYLVIFQYLSQYNISNEVRIELQQKLEIFLPKQQSGSQWYSSKCSQTLNELNVKEDDSIMVLDKSSHTLKNIQLSVDYLYTNDQVQAQQEEQKQVDKKSISTEKVPRQKSPKIMDNLQTFQITVTYSSKTMITKYGPKNNVDYFKNYKVTKEVEEVTEMILYGLKNTMILKLLPLEQIKKNMDHITIAIELELQPKKK